jgi:hypothetical protein
MCNEVKHDGTDVIYTFERRVWFAYTAIIDISLQRQVPLLLDIGNMG